MNKRQRKKKITYVKPLGPLGPWSDRTRGGDKVLSIPKTAGFSDHHDNLYPITAVITGRIHGRRPS